MSAGERGTHGLGAAESLLLEMEPLGGPEGKTEKERSWGQNPVPCRQEGPGPGNQGGGFRKPGQLGNLELSPLAGLGVAKEVRPEMWGSIWEMSAGRSSPRLVNLMTWRDPVSKFKN